MSFGRPTTIAAVLQAIVAQVVSACAYDASQVFFSMTDDSELSKFPSKDEWIQVAPREGKPRELDVIGGGELLTTTDLIVGVGLWLRLGLDVVYQDANQIAHESLGQAPKMQALIAALQMFCPADSSGQEGSIFAEPMRLIQFSFQPRKVQSGMAKWPTWWVVPCVLDLS